MSVIKEENSEKTIRGVITKGIGGFYYVDTPKGVIECRARGIFRKAGITPLVGDKVEISINKDNENEGALEVITERKNSLIRPPVANVTQIAAVIAAANPKPNLYIFDKLILSAEKIGVKILICINKTDLCEGEEYSQIYKKAGFETLMLSAKENVGVNELRERLKDEVTVFAGNSGVGKSSLLNQVMGFEVMETGEVSQKVERGKHTTRHSELMKLPFGGYIIDTPGFTSFELSDITTVELASMFREFEDYRYDCRFLDCSHTVEKDCGVIEALNDGKISRSRHDSYIKLYEELKKLKSWKN